MEADWVETLMLVGWEEACEEEGWAGLEGELVVKLEEVLWLQQLVAYREGVAWVSSCRRNLHSGNWRSLACCATICRQRCRPLVPTLSSTQDQL